MNNPTRVRIGEEEYPINSDFRVAIECNSIAKNTDIGEYERSLAIIYKLFGDKGLEKEQNYSKLLELGLKFLSCEQEIDNAKNKEPDMDYEQDEGYIRSSFKYDYQYDPYALQYLHWWDFFNDLNNLSNNEFGNCCVLNRVRNLRTLDTSKIKDIKEKTKAEEAKEQVALKKKKRELTKEQKESSERFKKLAGIG